MGPSNSGKSTLANAIGHARGLLPIHLDQLHHYPHTQWQPRPDEEFRALHNAAILGPSWVMDGNYSRCLPQRLARATGVILLDASTGTSLYRYLRRTWFGPVRHGTLEGSRDNVTWEMIHHILVVTRASRQRYEALFRRLHLPKVRLATAPELADFYRSEGLVRQ